MVVSMAGITPAFPGHQTHVPTLSLPPIVTSEQNTALDLVDMSIIFFSHLLLSSKICQMGPGAPVAY